jgi:hypothetical protein
MKPMTALIPALSASLLAGAFSTSPAVAQGSSLTQKINAYIGCINRLSERSYLSRSRYFSWASKKGPTGKERIIYGTYTIYDTTDCSKKVEQANALEPRQPEIEAQAADYVAAVTTLEPLLKEADDYYQQQDYKDDKMAKGKALHPRLIAAWDAFAKADEKLRASLDVLQDQQARERLAEIERTQGIKGGYYVEAVMQGAKLLMRVMREDPPNVAKITAAVAAFDEMVKAMDEYAEGAKGDKIGSFYVNSAKSFLTTAKLLMRRIRDKVPYSSGEKMILNTGSGGWMIEGSPARLTRDYNDLVGNYNRGGRI